MMCSLTFYQGKLYIFVFQLAYWVESNGPEDQGSIPGRVIPKTLKMVPDTSWLN